MCPGCECTAWVIFVAKALQAKNVLAQFFICRAQEQREAMLRAVSVRNRVGVSLLDYQK